MSGQVGKRDGRFWLALLGFVMNIALTGIIIHKQRWDTLPMGVFGIFLFGIVTWRHRNGTEE